jgi:hypothetical protein
MPEVENPAETTRLVDEAIVWLAERLPANWVVARSQQRSEARRLDGAIDLREPSGTITTLVVEARRELAPRDVDQLFSGLAGQLLALSSHIPVLIVAPWLSPRTRERLAKADVNYLDLTGNALIRLERPVLFLQTTGAERSPAPATLRGVTRLRGAKAGRLVRLLADVQPPYGLQELTAGTRLNPGYVSRLLDELDRETLIDREPRGPVRTVRVEELLRRWAQNYDVFRRNNAAAFVAPQGAASAFDRLVARRWPGPIAVTGSFAAARRAPVAAPALLALYCEEPSAVAADLDLLPADTGANVVLLSAFDPVVWERTRREDGAVYAADAQVAVDCLTGNGRMPAEGEALLGWMAGNESSWRAPSLDADGEGGRR